MDTRRTDWRRSLTGLVLGLGLTLGAGGVAAQTVLRVVPQADLKNIEDAFVRVLASIHHQRIRYQKDVEKDEDSEGEDKNGNGGSRPKSEVAGGGNGVEKKAGRRRNVERTP